MTVTLYSNQMNWISLRCCAGKISEENHTRLHDWYFIYMDVNIHIGSCQFLPFTDTENLEQSWY